MAKEGQISITCRINKVDPTTGLSIINWSRSESAVFDVAGAGGPYVGTVAATPGGTPVPFGAVGTPGLCLFTNQDTANDAYICFYDNHTGNLVPFMRLKPGTTLPNYLPEKFEEWLGGTPGTGSVMTDQLWVKSGSPTLSVNVRIEAFPE